jgi:hypothetical protein
MISITSRGRTRMKQRGKFKSKSIDRLAGIVFEKGLTHAETSGQLNGYLTTLYDFNGQANNIRLYGDHIYIFCNEVLVTVYDTPKRFMPIVNKLMRRKKENYANQ